ncbi:nucleotidyltransferase domain-containing protein [Candidatus Pacearchaeota archaeon]|nr:nucleotidyltransferase domain-containing protein [Candidatus Pacearchaeota archaeon]
MASRIWATMRMSERLRVVTKIGDIPKIAEEIAKNKNVKAVYLFGSHATGMAYSLSDIDLCVIGKLDDKEKLKAMSFSSDNLDISFFEELPIYIKFRVLNEGRLLFVRDNDYLNVLKIKIMREYIDFKPMINKYIQRVIYAQS